MNKFIKNIVAFSLKNKAFTFFWVGVLVISGFVAFKGIKTDNIIYSISENGEKYEFTFYFNKGNIAIFYLPIYF